MITALFAYMFRRGINGTPVLPRGEETINRINANLEALDLSLPVKPTTDQDVFAYRAEIRFKSFVFSEHYKLEIGDFPGEDTVLFAEKHGPWLHNTGYFQWAIGADAFIFVIDAGMVVLDKSGEYAARQKSALRAAWQRLQDQYLDGTGPLSKRPLLLVFTKADEYIELNSASLGSETPETPKNSPSRRQAKPDEVIECELAMKSHFADLIEYFERESSRFETIVESVYLKVGSERLGIPEIARRVMPRQKSWLRHLNLFR
jgi:hypothetical protein